MDSATMSNAVKRHHCAGLDVVRSATREILRDDLDAPVMGEAVRAAVEGAVRALRDLDAAVAAAVGASAVAVWAGERPLTDDEVALIRLRNRR